MTIVPGLEIGVGLLIIITTWIGTFGISFIFLFFDKIRYLLITLFVARASYISANTYLKYKNPALQR